MRDYGISSSRLWLFIEYCCQVELGPDVQITSPACLTSTAISDDWGEPLTKGEMSLIINGQECGL